jgi:hypothetical protein
MAKCGRRVIQDGADSETLCVRAQNRASQRKSRAKKAEQTQLSGAYRACNTSLHCTRAVRSPYPNPTAHPTATRREADVALARQVAENQCGPH